MNTQAERDLSLRSRPAQWQGRPTALRIALGGHLRQLREASGITRDAAGYAIRASSSKISRLELGRVAFKERDVADLLTLYGVTDAEEREALLTLAAKQDRAATSLLITVACRVYGAQPQGHLPC